MMNNGLKRWKILLLLYTKEINKLWNCFLSSSGYSNMGKKCKYGWFFKGHQWCWYRFPNCNFPPDFGPLCNGFFSDYTMYDVHFSPQDTIQSWFCIRGKKIWKQCTYNVLYISGRSTQLCCCYLYWSAVWLIFSFRNSGNQKSHKKDPIRPSHQFSSQIEKKSKLRWVPMDLSTLSTYVEYSTKYSSWEILNF